MMETIFEIKSAMAEMTKINSGKKSLGTRMIKTLSGSESKNTEMTK